MLNVGVVGAGIIGKRVVAAIERQADMSLVGVAVRSPRGYPLARPDLRYFASEPGAEDVLAGHGLSVAGPLADLLAAVDVVVDCGPSRSGIGRLPHYEKAGARVLFSGGERAAECGPVVHPALGTPGDLHVAPAVRLPSCNTTAMARLVAAVDVTTVTALDATLVRCGTDSDKAAKGVVSGAAVTTVLSHHSHDLQALVPRLQVHSVAMTVPMLSGHVIRADLTFTRDRSVEDLRSALTGVSRVQVMPPGETIRTDVLRDRAADSGRLWDDRFELVVGIVDAPAGKRHTFWLSLDNEAITIPECIDVVRLMGAGVDDPTKVGEMTDAALGVGDIDVTAPAAWAQAR